MDASKAVAGGIVAALIVLVASAGGLLWAQTKAKNACELLTPAEIAKGLSVAAVKKDEVNSGEHVMGHVDICSWYVKENSPEGLEVRWWRAKPGPGEPLAEFSAAKGHAFEHDSARSEKAQQLTGVGAEAVYGPFPDGTGGSLALRTARGAAALVGTASKDSLVALAKLAAARM
jgi:hypothetical protein